MIAEVVDCSVLMHRITSAIAHDAFLLLLDYLIYTLILLLASITVLTVLILVSVVITNVVLVNIFFLFIDPKE